jgi:hypothetical protein
MLKLCFFKLYFSIYSLENMATAGGGGGGNFNLNPVQSTSVAGKIVCNLIRLREKLHLSNSLI